MSTFNSTDYIGFSSYNRCNRGCRRERRGCRDLCYGRDRVQRRRGPCSRRRRPALRRPCDDYEDNKNYSRNYNCKINYYYGY